MNVSVLGWLTLVLALCVSTFGASCVVIIVLGFLSFIIGLLTLLYVQSGNFEDVYFSCNLLNNPLAVQEIPAGGLAKVVERVKKPKPAEKSDQRVTGSDLIDSSLQEIFGYIIRDYVQPWYSLISTDTEFVEIGVRKSAQTLAIHISNRVKEIDWLPYLTTRLVDDAATQLRLFRGARAQDAAAAATATPGSPRSPRHRRNKSDTDVAAAWRADSNLEHVFFQLEGEAGRGAVCMDATREAAFLAALAELLLYVLLPDADFHCAPLRALLRQLAARCLLRPLADLAADPDNINFALLSLCARDGTLSSEAFLTALRLTEDTGELRHARDLVARELQAGRGRPAPQLASLHYVARLIDSRLASTAAPHPQPQPPPHALVHLPLDSLLNNNVALSYFIDYVASVGQQAPLFLYLSVVGWRASPQRETARHILAHYEPHVPPHLLRALHRRLHDPATPLTHTWFDELQQYVYDQMNREDVFVAGFERSAGYARLLAELELLHAETGEDEVDEPAPMPARPAKHARSYSDITCNTAATAATAPLHRSESHQHLAVSPAATAAAASDDSDEDCARLKVGNFTLSVDIIEAGVMSDKGKTFGIYATQVSKLYDSGLLEQWHIYRRYSDFYELQARVRERWPPLGRLAFPGKKPFQNAERALLERRMRALNMYMAALCRRPALDAHPGLRALLQEFTEQAEYDRAASGPIRALRHKVDEMVGRVFSSNSKATAPGPLDEGDTDIPLRVLLALADEVFDLRSRNQWLRRRLVTLLRQIVRAWFGDIVSRRIVEWVALGTSPRNVARGLRGVQRAVWPGGVRAPSRPRRSPAARARTRLAAKVALLAVPALADELKRLLGSETTRRGLLTVFDLAQRPTLTRRLLYVLLEGALAHLLPEKPVPQLFRQLYAAANTDKSN